MLVYAILVPLESIAISTAISDFDVIITERAAIFTGSRIINAAIPVNVFTILR
jgi:hypothetical protein